MHETLKETGRGTSGRHWLRSSLVVVEVATTLVLLIGAGLMIRSFYLLQKVNPGFSHEHLTSFSVSLPQKKYATEEQQASFYNRLLENIRALAGCGSLRRPHQVCHSAIMVGKLRLPIEGQPVPERDQTPLMEACLVTPDYFRAMNIPVLRGRVFTDRDDRSHLAGRDLSKMNENQRAMAGVNIDSH